MSKNTNESIETILREMRDNTSAKIWDNKGSIIFTLKSMYGDCLDVDKAKDMYDKINNEVEDES